MKTILSALTALVLCLALASVAYGQSSVQGYNDEKGAVQEQVDNNTTPVAAEAEACRSPGLTLRCLSARAACSWLPASECGA